MLVADKGKILCLNERRGRRKSSCFNTGFWKNPLKDMKNELGILRDKIPEDKGVETEFYSTPCID